MNKYNSKDFVIFKIRIYASDYLLKKYKTSLPSQHRTRIKSYIDFKHKFVYYCLNKTQQEYMMEYFFNSIECAKEEISEKLKIFFIDEESHITILIPKDNEKIIEYCKTNLLLHKLPYKILKRKNISFLEYRKFDIIRKNTKQFMESSIHYKNFIRTLKINKILNK